MRVFVLFVMSGAVLAQQPALPRIGEPAPGFAFASVVPTDARPLASIADLTPEKLRGKVVVLDFFATWCLPCVASIAHTNEVIAATRDLPVVFLAVANEERAALDKVLAEHPMQATLVLDRDGTTWRHYWIAKLPFVAIVGPDGRLAAFEHPERLSRETVLRALGASLVTRP